MSDWQFHGKVQHLIYSPRGDHEGVLLDVDGVPVQFVCAPHQAAWLAGIAPGQRLDVVGRERDAKHAHPGRADHEVYELVSIDGAGGSDRKARGRVVRLNYAKHGEPNGVVLDSGDFIHTRPPGLRELGWKVGDQVEATGRSQPLVDGRGVVVEWAGEVA